MMSMLAEKKKRQKWCLNPRGKSWSDDKNKFGQRLLEKMGWNSGQGLGVNNQGQTEIVKVKMKDDNKGLGFKGNKEEWLKTTHEYNELLEQLGSNKEGDAKESKITSSLEDRSKKSKTRVHYHKFTRGKDLSRYSEKDLASIVGPDVMKSREPDEMDYSCNQVNKGSSTEYFKNKEKLKNVTEHISALTTSSDEHNIILPRTDKGSHYNMKKIKNGTQLGQFSECTNEEPCIYPRNKKIKKKTERSTTNPCLKSKDKEQDSFTDSCHKMSSTVEVPIKKRKKMGHESSVYNGEGSIENSRYSSTKPELQLQVESNEKNENNLCGHKIIEKEKKKGCSTNVIQTALDTEPHTKVLKKKKKSKNISEFINFKSDIDESLENSNTEMKMESSNSFNGGHSTKVRLNQVVSRRKNIDNNALVKMSSYDEESLETKTTNIYKNSVKLGSESEIEKKSDSKSEKKIENTHLNNPTKKKKPSKSFAEAERDYKSISIVSLPAESVIGRLGSKGCVVEDTTKSEETKLKKKLKKIQQCIENCQEIQSDEIQVTKEEEHSGSSTKQCKALIGKNISAQKLPPNNSFHREQYDSEIKSGHENNSSEGAYLEPKEHNYKASKATILYEYSLLKNCLKKLGIEEPSEATLKTINNNNLDRASNRKLRLIYRSKQIKLLLPLKEVTDIEQKINKFSKLVKRRTKMFGALKEIEKKVYQLSNDLVKTENYTKSSTVKEMDPQKQLDSSVIEIIQNVSEQLKALETKSIDLTRQESQTKCPASVTSDMGNINEISIASKKSQNKKQGTDQNQYSGQSRCRIKEKLQTLMEQVNQLLLGKIPIEVSQQDDLRKNDSLPFDVPQKEKCTNNKYRSSLCKRTNSIHSEKFHSPTSKKGSDQMFDYQRGKEGFQMFDHQRGKEAFQRFDYQRGMEGFQKFDHQRGKEGFQMFDYQRGKEGFRRGFGVRSSLSFRGRGFNSSRFTYAKEYQRGMEGFQQFDHQRGMEGFQKFDHQRAKEGFQMFDYQRGKEGFRRGFGVRSSLYFRGRGFNSSRFTYAKEDSYGVRGLSCGRSSHRGRGGRELRARGRISQNNFDAKQYAEKCKAENKVPELGFKGVDLKMIFGYAAI